jgi:hypothetical protein
MKKALKKPKNKEVKLKKFMNQYYFLGFKTFVNHNTYCLSQD